MDIGFIGLGRMGGPMARHIGATENRLTVFDVRSEASEAVTGVMAGVHGAGSVAAAAEGADVVLASLPGPPEVEAVMLGPGGLKDTLKPGAIVIDLSTNAPALAREVAASLAEGGVTFLDAPVSGGVEGAEAATLAIMVGGDEATFEKMKPLLETIGANVFYCGPSGAGCVTKLCNNIASGAYGLILAEALTLGVKAGVDLQTLASVIGASTGSSPRLVVHLPRYLFKRNFTPGFSTALAAKDTRLALELAEQLGVPMKIGGWLQEESQVALDRGWGVEDMDAIMKLQEERAGVVLEVGEQ